MSKSTAGRPACRGVARAIVILSLATLAEIPVSHHALAQQGPTSVSYSIPAGSLGTALTRWAQTSGIKLLASAEALKGRTTSGLSGTYEPQQALSTLLAGTGLTYAFNGATVTVSDASAAGDATGATLPGAIALDTIDVSGGGAAAQDQPYMTPGSTSHVSRETLDRVPPTSPGDVFITTPGVINAGNRVGTSINPNIRGLQGMGRVNTTIDGARQNTSTYRGYIGNRDETYVDPDMIGGIDISKGPSDGVGVGGIGGTINFRTLAAEDIVKPGETKGSRVKASLGSNTSSEPDAGTTVRAERPGIDLDTFSGSFATAVLQDNYEGVVAYSKRKQGNYFAGTDVPDGLSLDPLGAFGSNRAQVQAGAEVFNTSENTESLLAKMKLKGEEQSLELSYLYYGSASGQVNELLLTTGIANAQYDLTNIHGDTYTAKYRYTPDDNPLVKVRANAWLTDLSSDRFMATILQPYGTRTVGGDIGNTSVVTTALGELTLDNGGEFVREHATAEQFPSTATGSNGWETFGPSAVRLMLSAYSNASYKPTDWLTLSGGARYDWYNSEGEGYLTRFPEKSGSRVSPNAGIVVTPFEGIQLYGKYSEGYRPPSLRESHWHYQGLLFNNPDLRPEIAENKEVGLNVLRDDVALSGDKLRFKASWFDNFYDDYILRWQLPRRPGSTGNQYMWTNMNSATYRGFELSGSYDARNFFFEGAFTKYTKIEYCTLAGTCGSPMMGTAIAGSSPNPIATDYVSNYIPPEYSGSITLGVRAFDEKLTLGARTHFAGVRSGTTWMTGNAARVGVDVSWPEYVIFDVFGSYKFTDDMLANFSVENITDEYYFGALASIGLPSPGRTFRFGLTRTLGEDAIPTIPDLALGRAAEGTPGSNWTGLYIGGYVGYGVADMDGETTAADGTPGGIPATESVDLRGTDLPRGAQIGFNYELPNRLVVGLEGDIGWSTLYDKQEAVATESATLARGSWRQAETEYEFDWTATLRGRVGYAFDRFLVYGTGGLAFLNEEQVRTQYIDSLMAPTAARPIGTSTVESFKESSSAVRLGWTVGTGVEYAFANNWSLKGEYQFADFGEEEFLFPGARSGVVKGYDVRTRCTPNNSTPPCPGGFNGFITTHTKGSSETTNGRKALNDLDLHTVKIGVNYRF